MVDTKATQEVGTSCQIEGNSVVILHLRHLMPGGSARCNATTWTMMNVSTYPYEHVLCVRDKKSVRGPFVTQLFRVLVGLLLSLAETCHIPDNTRCIECMLIG